MNPREINDPLPGLGQKIEPMKPPEPFKPDARLSTNPQVRIAPDGKFYTDVPENSRAKWEGQCEATVMSVVYQWALDNGFIEVARVQDSTLYKKRV